MSDQKTNEIPKWLNEINRHSRLMSMDIRSSFVKRLQDSENVLPPNDEARAALINIFLSHLFATSVHLATQAMNCSTEFEADVIKGIRRDFAQRRRASFEGKGDAILT